VCVNVVTGCRLHPCILNLLHSGAEGFRSFVGSTRSHHSLPGRRQFGKHAFLGVTRSQIPLRRGIFTQINTISTRRPSSTFDVFHRPVVSRHPGRKISCAGFQRRVPPPVFGGDSRSVTGHVYDHQGQCAVAYLFTLHPPISI